MKNHKRLLTLLCLLFPSTLLSASQDRSRKLMRAPDGPMQTVHVDAETGVQTRGASIRRKAAGGAATAVSVNNLDFGGFIGFDSGENGQNGPCEWFSSVQKGAGSTGGQSTYLSAISFAYCGLAQDTKSGGPGTTVTLNFWDGFTSGSGSLAGSTGTQVGSITLTGLPGNTGVVGWYEGGEDCVAVLVEAAVGGGAPIVLPDSNVGVSFVFKGLDANGVFGHTATFLSCIASCSDLSPAGGPYIQDGSGMIDVIDQYCGGTFRESFSFVTGPGFTLSYSSISFQLRELVPLDSSDSQTFDNGPANCNSSTIATSSAPLIGGGAWIQDVDCGTVPGSLTVSFSSFLALNPAACANSPTGDFLVNPSAGRIALLSAMGSRSAGSVSLTLTPSVPLDLAFVGTRVHSQGYCAGSPVPVGETRLTNRTTICIGTLE